VCVCVRYFFLFVILLLPVRACACICYNKKFIQPQLSTCFTFVIFFSSKESSIILFAKLLTKAGDQQKQTECYAVVVVFVRLPASLHFVVFVMHLKYLFIYTLSPEVFYID